MPSNTLLAAGLESALNRYLELGDGLQGHFAQLKSKVLGVEISGLQTRLFLVVGERRISVLDVWENTPDAIFSGSPLSLLRALTRGSWDQDIVVRGDAELGRHFQALLAAVDFDWEEQLSRVVGDVPAHQVGNLVRGVLDWGQKALNTVTQNLSEYLQEETRDLPRHDEVERFLDQVDELRADTDRLRARVARLEQRAGHPREAN